MARKSYPNIQWRGGTAQLEIVIQGKRVRESLDTGDPKEAILRRDARVVELTQKSEIRRFKAQWLEGAERAQAFFNSLTPHQAALLADWLNNNG